MNAHPVLDSITKLDAPASTLKAPTVFMEDEETPRVNHYARTHRGVQLDVYRILKLYGITDPAVAHAAKKLFRFGSGQHKSRRQDIVEAIASLQRWLDMEDEDAAEKLTQPQP